jgi:hypothetical protein
MSSPIPSELRAFLSSGDALISDSAAQLGNPNWTDASARVLVVRLSPFSDVERSTPHLVLFSECRKALPDAYIDFSFLPGRSDREILAERSLPWFHGLASGMAPSSFDLVMVSLSFTLELVNLPYLFSTSGIASSTRARETLRQAGTPAPIVILGGSSAASAGALIRPDGDAMVDGLFFGEGEAGCGSAGFGAIGELAQILAAREGSARERLEKARSIVGFWIPGMPADGRGDSPRRRIARPVPAPIVTYPVLNSDEAGTARLQITAGCPGLCSFCLEGWDRRPYRELSLGEITRAARELRLRTGADTLEVGGFNFNTHSRVFELMFELNRVFRRVNFMSQRLDILAATPALARAELAAGKRSFTLGIEGLSRRMRAYFRKGISDDEIDGSIALVTVKGVRELKLFYIIAGIEDESDLSEFRAFAAAIAERRRAGSPGLRVLVSAGYLVRLPSTPLMYAPLCLDESRLEEIAESMRACCETNGLEFRLAVRFDEYGVEQLLALGGPSLYDWLAALPERGYCYDGSLSRGTWRSLRSFAERTDSLDPDLLGEKRSDWTPGISFLDSAPLRRQYEAAREFVDRRRCLGSACSDCGACAEASDRASIASHPAPALPDTAYIDRLTRLVAAKEAFVKIIVEAEIPPDLAGATPAYLSSWLSRRLFAAAPGAERAVFEAKECLFTEGPLEGLLAPGFTGRSLFALYGPDPASARTAALAAGFIPQDGTPSIARVDIEVEIPPPWSSGALSALRGWLSGSGVAFIERSSRETRLFETAGRDLRKRVLISASAAEGPTFRARLSLGVKARVPEWLRALGPRAAEASRVAVLAYGELAFGEPEQRSS